MDGWPPEPPPRYSKSARHFAKWTDLDAEYYKPAYLGFEARQCISSQNDGTEETLYCCECCTRPILGDRWKKFHDWQWGTTRISSKSTPLSDLNHQGRSIQGGTVAFPNNIERTSLRMQRINLPTIKRPVTIADKSYQFFLVSRYLAKKVQDAPWNTWKKPSFLMHFCGKGR